jgi:hypothetical protein
VSVSDALTGPFADFHGATGRPANQSQLASRRRRGGKENGGGEG